MDLVADKIGQEVIITTTTNKRTGRPYGPALSSGTYKSVWDFGRAGRANYSVHGLGEYPSKIRPIVVAEVVNRFSEKGKTILDPFCGGGTVAIEAKLQGRNSINFDISPFAVSLARRRLEALDANEMKRVTREFLEETRHAYAEAKTRFQRLQKSKQLAFYEEKLRELEDEHSDYYKTLHTVEVRDARELGLPDESVDAVITDIPYASMIRYSDLEDDLSNIEDYRAFLNELSKALSEIWRVLKKGKYCVVFVADYRIGAARRILPVHADVISIMQRLGFELFDIYIWRYYRSGGFRPFGKAPYQAMNVHIYILAFYKSTGSEQTQKSNRPPRYRPRLIEKMERTRKAKMSTDLLTYIF